MVRDNSQFFNVCGKLLVGLVINLLIVTISYAQLPSNTEKLIAEEVNRQCPSLCPDIDIIDVTVEGYDSQTDGTYHVKARIVCRPGHSFLDIRLFSYFKLYKTESGIWRCEGVESR